MNNISKFATITGDIIVGLKQRHADLHPIVFLRSVERAKDVFELFDILETTPLYPYRWDESTREYVTTYLSKV